MRDLQGKSELSLIHISLRDEVIGDGFDMVIMRELTGGLYFGERHTEEVDGVRTAVDTLSYNENEIRRIAIKAFDIARKRNKHVISVCLLYTSRCV